ncbi:SHOCT domain-containing protein [Marinifilum fragile]|uniref:SHOCT domain-containing protein n=1 Tax=Marinifilum fragile TaxID=570161 RepID=UPI002AABE6E0|nr:SHOCT domain-containing protein [Marinifilum fragile]
MTKRALITSLCLLLAINLFAKRDKVTYAPVAGFTSENVWPAVKVQLDFNKVPVESWSFANQKLKSTWQYYTSGISKKRCKWIFTYSDNLLHVEMVDIQTKIGDDPWKAYGTSQSKSERTMHAYMAMGVASVKENKDNFNKAIHNFYTSLETHSFFYQNATEIAGKRWFERYLKDKEVNWDLVFSNIDESTQVKLYKETFVYVVEGQSKDFTFDNSNFFITKYTDSDANVFTSKGSQVEVTGVCKELINKGNVFYIVLEDRGVVDNKSNSIADELIKLKGLLDQGIITEEEFDTQKRKILEG